MDEGASQMIECPGSTCDILVDDQTVMNLVFGNLGFKLSKWTS